MMKKILLVLLAVILIIQFFRPTQNLGEAEGENDLTHYMEVPTDVRSILKNSCYDCHSNKTKYPWYAEVMPLGWWLDHHVKEGKEELNFSDFSKYDLKKIDHKLEETAEMIEGSEMPLKSYLYLHKHASLTDEQKARLVEWVKIEREKLKLQKK